MIITEGTTGCQPPPHHRLEEQTSPEESDMEIIKDKDRSLAPVDERVAALEKKMKETDAMVKGLTEELLDLKSVVMKISKVSEERARAEMRMSKPPAPPVAGGPVILQKKPAAAPSQQKPTQAPIEAAAEKMDMIMQPNGTLAPEKRKNSDYIIASAGFSKKKQGSSGPGKKNDLIVAEDEETDSAHKK